MNIQRQFSVLFLITVTVSLLIAATNLAAGPIKVNSANPNSGALGETHRVEIKGQGFAHANSVRFLVNRSSKDDTGHVEVYLEESGDNCLDIKGEPDCGVYGDSTIIADVVIPKGATIADYDIEVQLMGGRKGKGTTLFRVRTKDELPLTFVPVSGFWSGAVTEDNGSIDERWRWDTSNDDVDLDMPRPCGSGGLAVGGIRARFNCQKGGRIFVDLRGTSWVVSDNGNNRKMNEGFCELLNDWATFGDIEEYLVIFGPTFPDFAYDTIPNPDDGCPVEGPCGFSTNYASYFGQPRPHVEEVELHPFGHLPETDLPAVGRIQFRAFGESSDIVLSPNDLNPFMEPQTVAMTYFQIAFYAAHGGPVIGRCETEGLKAWFNTEPTEPTED